jgi:hypothetical protein
MEAEVQVLHFHILHQAVVQELELLPHQVVQVVEVVPTQAEIQVVQETLVATAQ